MATGTSIVRHDPAARLAAFNRVSTDSVDAAADAIGRIFCPHELKPTVRSSPDFFALHNSAVFGGFSVNYVAYGGSVSIDPGLSRALLPVANPRTRFGADPNRLARRRSRSHRLRFAIVADDSHTNDLAGQLRPAHSAGRSPPVGATGCGAVGPAGGRGRVRTRGRSVLHGRPGASVADLGTRRSRRTPRTATAAFADQRPPICARRCWVVCSTASAIVPVMRSSDLAVEPKRCRRRYDGRANFSTHMRTSRSILSSLPRPQAPVSARCSSASSGISERRSRRCCAISGSHISMSD